MFFCKSALQHKTVSFTTSVKWTLSEPLENKKQNRNIKSDIAYLGSKKVTLKGYQTLNENCTIPQAYQMDVLSRETNKQLNVQTLWKQNSFEYRQNRSNQASRSSNSIALHRNTLASCSNVVIERPPNRAFETVSFEGLIRQNEVSSGPSTSKEPDAADLSWEEGVNIDNLSDRDHLHLKPILYEKLMAIFDKHKINIHKRKAGLKSKGGNVFGVNLANLVMRDISNQADNSMVPKVFETILRELNSRCITDTGILRVAGQKQKLEALCREIEDNFYSNREHVVQLINQATSHELTGVLKRLLRELPDPIFTMELFDMFYDTNLIPNADDKRKALNLLVLMLPIEQRNTYRMLLEFLLNVVKHEDQNKMNLHNVAMISTPSFFPPRLLLLKSHTKLFERKKPELNKQVNEAAVCCCIIEMMLKFGEKLWTVPNCLVNQAREAQKQAQQKKDATKEEDVNVRLGTTRTPIRTTNRPKTQSEFLI